MIKTQNEIWNDIADLLGIKVSEISGKDIGCGDDTKRLLVHDFGGIPGTVILLEGDDYNSVSQSNVFPGIGFSEVTVGEVNEEEILFSIVEMLSEWEWTGDDDRMPEFLQDDGT